MSSSKRDELEVRERWMAGCSLSFSCISFLQGSAAFKSGAGSANWCAAFPHSAEVFFFFFFLFFFVVVVVVYRCITWRENNFPCRRFIPGQKRQLLF